MLHAVSLMLSTNPRLSHNILIQNVNCGEILTHFYVQQFYMFNSHTMYIFLDTSFVISLSWLWHNRHVRTLWHDRDQINYFPKDVSGLANLNTWSCFILYVKGEQVVKRQHLTLKVYNMTSPMCFIIRRDMKMKRNRY